MTAPPSGQSLSGFKQLLKSPAGLRPAVRLEPDDDPSVLAVREPPVCLLDCMKTPGLNGQIVHLAAERRHCSIGLKEEDEQSEEVDFSENPQQINTINPESDQQPDRCDTDIESGSDDKDPNWEESKTSYAGDDGTARLVQVKTAPRSNSEERQEEADCTEAKSQNGPSDSVSTPEAEEVEASEPAAGAERNQQEVESKPQHHCEHCGKSFARRSNVIRHQRHHCSPTRAAPSQPASEQAERETHSCNKRTKRRLRLRVRVHRENWENQEGKETSAEAPRERLHACTQCNKSFYLSHTLRQHLLTHTGEKSYSCEVCGKQFGREGTLKEHQLIHTGEKPFKCEQCGKTCARRGDLKIHMLSHSEQRPFSCSYCEKSFKQLAKLKQHERVHTGEKPYQCRLCSKRFRLQISLAAHRFTHSGEKPFKCTLCPKAFSVRNNLKKHQMIHTGEKMYRCSHCGKSCRLLQHLIVHERSHTGEKPYKCATCGKAYSHPSALKTHQSTHEGKPPHRRLCGQGFTELSELTGHECGGETAEKPHSCSQCGKCFSQAVSLKKHWLIHSGEKPYDCKECGKQFNHKSNLTKHTRIHTGEKPFECDRCQRGFRLLQHLTNHQLTHRKQ